MTEFNLDFYNTNGRRTYSHFSNFEGFLLFFFPLLYHHSLVTMTETHLTKLILVDLPQTGFFTMDLVTILVDGVTKSLGDH